MLRRFLPEITKVQPKVRYLPTENPYSTALKYADYAQFFKESDSETLHFHMVNAGTGTRRAGHEVPMHSQYLRKSNRTEGCTRLKFSPEQITLKRPHTVLEGTAAFAKKYGGMHQGEPLPGTSSLSSRFVAKYSKTLHFS